LRLIVTLFSDADLTNADNRSNKGTGDHGEITKDVKRKGEVETAEQGETAISGKTGPTLVSSKVGE
jgi:hypothetical protein